MIHLLLFDHSEWVFYDREDLIDLTILVLLGEGIFVDAQAVKGVDILL